MINIFRFLLKIVHIFISYSFNLTYFSVTIEEYVNLVIEMLDEKVQIKYHPMRATETSKFNPDLTKIKNVLNYSAKTSLREGIAKTIKWYLENK